MSKPIAYYAHPMSWYDTAEEDHDRSYITGLGFDLYDPNSDRVKQNLDFWLKGHRRAQIMDFFAGIVQWDVDLVFYRPFRDGTVGSGVAREVLEAFVHQKPVYELDFVNSAEPGAYAKSRSTIPNRILSLGETRQRIYDKQL